jgi:serine/threonine protein kinase
LSIKKYLNWLRDFWSINRYHIEISIDLTVPILPQLIFEIADVVTIQSVTSANLGRNKFMVQTASCSTILQEIGSANKESILPQKYQVRSLLGRGGFGVTFLARNISLPGEPLCVIKKLAPRFTDPQLMAIARKQFDLESLSLSRLGSHARIPSLLDCFKIGTDCYLVEEYIPGVVLSEIISKQRKFTAAEVEKFLIQMLEVLQYMHSHYLIHRDIKPQNIILCQTDRRFVLVDFGAVKNLDPVTLDRDRLDDSRAVGTPEFAPPEQLADRTVYASDLYALGMTCIYLLTGKEPSQFSTDPHTCELLWSDNIDLSVDFIEIINKMTQIPLVDRYQSATQVLTALENRSIRAKLRAYLDQKHAVAKSEYSGSLSQYPAVIHWALKIA